MDAGIDVQTTEAERDTLPERLGERLKMHPLWPTLSSLGPPDPDPEPSCSRCYDGGYLRPDVPANHPDFGKIVPCDCRRSRITAARIARFWQSSQAPAEYRDCTLESYVGTCPPGDPSAVPALRAWLETDRWLILAGDYGAGKTGLTVALLRILAERGTSVLFVNAPAMLRRVRATYAQHDEAESESKVIDSLAEADVLAIDDIGKERLSEWGSELLYDVVNRRYSQGRRTIVTTNLGVDRLEVHLGSATFWRLFEKSQLVHVTGNLRRRKGG
jgi:DNA replication protein DnaC